MFDMRFKTAERRCLVFGLKMLLKDARNEKEGRFPVYYNDDYWKIDIIRKNKKATASAIRKKTYKGKPQQKRTQQHKK